MANEILKDEILKDEQLDNVAGGSDRETFADMDYVTRYTGIQFHGSSSNKRAQLRDLLWEGGIQIKDHTVSENRYYVIDEKTGNRLYETDRQNALYYAVMNIRRKRGM